MHVQKPWFWLLTITALSGCTKEVGPVIEDDDGPATDLSDDSGAAEGSDNVGDSIEDAAEIKAPNWYAWDEEKVWEETINPAGDRDFYMIIASEGDAFRFYTSSYHLLNDTVVLDTVLRVYDPQGELIATNDDMPYRYWETDSGVYFQATQDGPYYIEVLEFADWQGTGTNGGPTYEYELWGTWLLSSESLDLPHQTVEQADALWDQIIDGKVNGIYLSSPPYSDFTVEFYGELEAGQTDVWPYETNEPDKADPEEYTAYIQWSLWPEGFGDLAPQLTLYNQAGEMLAQTDEPQIEPEYPFIWDAGITYKVDSDTRYFLEVTDLNGGSGDTRFYPGLMTFWLPSLGEVETEPNETEGQGNWIEMEESTTTSGFFFGRMTGTLSMGDVDTLLISSSGIGGLDDKYLEVEVHAKQAGSMLDATLIVTDVEGRDIATATGNTETGSVDPMITGVELNNDTDLVLTIEPESADAFDPSNSWFVRVYVSDDP